MLGKECLCKVNQIRNYSVIGICPEGCELKAVACFTFLAPSCIGILDGIESRAVGIILGICSIGNNKYLHILIESTACPETVTLISVYLIESLSNGNASAF